MAKRSKKTEIVNRPVPDYGSLLTGISDLLEHARRMSARSVNSILTATYWEVGRRIVEYEQGGKARAEYGEELLKRLGSDLTATHGRGFSWRNLFRMRGFYLGWDILPTASAKLEAHVRPPPEEGVAASEIGSTALSKSGLTGEAEPPEEADGPKLPTALAISGQGKVQKVSAESAIVPTARQPFDLSRAVLVGAFPLSWSHYVRLMSVTTARAQAFYEAEAVRGGWSVRQLDRQINTQFYERSSHSKRQAAMLARGQIAKPEDAMTVEDEVRDPYLLEFLNLKDEYSENELEEALIRHLEWFLLELGAGFTFVARQKRIRIGGVWYRIDLLLYHRGLRCLVVIDLKTGEFTHADAGQMNLYLNYAKRHLMLPDEADPVGIILCSEKDDAVVEYAIGDIRAKVFASKYLTNLPDKETLRQEIMNTQRALAAHKAAKGEDA
jgi:predicted nuclease of restriction endonuclease-like (RecB) superfamily